jgi:DNA topoisomerase I
MPKHLVVVESPTKAKTIKRFLGRDFTVEASMGHVRDLPETKIGVDVEDAFAPQYVVPKEKLPVIKRLQEALEEAEDLWIATDEDREGEAIGWHLTEVLQRRADQQVKRIVFHEITEEAINEAAAHPRSIDHKLVDAQQARRILDRLVGYTLSPFLWKKVYRGLSAGRVQSVAVRIIVDREREIQAFKTVEYWSITADLNTEKQESFVARLVARDGQKFVPCTAEEAQSVVDAAQHAPFAVASVEEKEIRRTPPPPFTTSTLQQEAGRKLGFSVKQTMVVAQQLYEGVNLGKGDGQTGLITYMRTDSVHLSDKAHGDAKAAIEKLYGREYILAEPRRYKTKSKGAQEAHEAIRPAEMNRTPESLKGILDHQQLKLYTLIWNRTVATQMVQAELKRVSVDIQSDRYMFRATGQTMLFDGFLRLYIEGRDEPEEQRAEDEPEEGERLLPRLSEGQKLSCSALHPEQHFTKPPPRYTEASLVKKLEEEGIGRPSTYAPTIFTVQQRGYITKEGKQLKPEEVACTVTDLLAEHFPDIVDLGFTAHMEQSLDDIAEGGKQWQGFLGDFYKPFKKLIDRKSEEISRDDILKERELGSDAATGLVVLVRTGRFGPYVQLGRLEDMEDAVPTANAQPRGKKPKKVKKVKPKSASLPKHLDKESVTLEQALALLSFPRRLGLHEGAEVEVHLGRFGPYVKCGVVTVPLLDRDPGALDIADAVALLIEGKERKARMAEPLRTLGEDPATGAKILVKDGRYGPYVSDGKTNASLGKKHTPESITLEQAGAMLAKKRAAGPGRRWGKKRT